MASSPAKTIFLPPLLGTGTLNWVPEKRQACLERVEGGVIKDSCLAPDCPTSGTSLDFAAVGVLRQLDRHTCSLKDSFVATAAGRRWG